MGWASLLVLLGNCLFLVKKFFPGDSPAENILAFLTFGYSQIVGISIILGLAGKLSASFFLLGLLFLFFILWLFPRPGKTLPQTQKPGAEINFLTIGSGILIFSFYLVFIYYQGLLPPLTTDGLYYHLPFAGHWLKIARIEPVPLFFHNIAPTYYPIDGDLIFLYHFLVLKSDFLINFAQLPFLIYGAVALFLIMRKIGFSASQSFYGTCLFVLFKPVFRQSGMVFVDLMLSSFFLATAFYFLSVNSKNILLGFMNAGLMIGTKNSGPIFFLSLLPLLLINFFRSRNKNITAVYFLAGLIFILGLGGYSYLNNLFLTGNPVYPAFIKIGGWELPGIYFYQNFSFIVRFKTLGQVFLNPASGIDPTREIFIFLIILWLAGLILSLKNKLLTYLLLIPLISIIFYGLVVPIHLFQLRLLLPVYSFFCMGAAVFLIRIAQKQVSFKGLKNLAMFLLLIVFGFDANIDCAGKGFGLVLIGSLLAWLILHLKQSFKKLAVVAITAGALWLAVPRLVFLAGVYPRLKFSVYKFNYGLQAEIWEFVAKFKNDKNKVIAYVGNFLIYPFYGERLQNYVYYQPVNNKEETPIHRYQLPLFDVQLGNQIAFDDTYRSHPDFSLWFEGLKKHRVDLIVIRKIGSYKYLEESWMAKNKAFIPIFENDFGKVYQFVNQ